MKRNAVLCNIPVITYLKVSNILYLYWNRKLAENFNFGP